MTEQELDLFMRNVLLDAIALDEETNTETIPYTPSLHHQRQIKAMLKNPLRWARDRKQPVWKRALKRVAVILLVISLAFGSLMVVSPTARATFIRWVTEWYETHVTYRYAGDDMVDDLPEYPLLNYRKDTLKIVINESSLVHRLTFLIRMVILILPLHFTTVICNKVLQLYLFWKMQIVFPS